MQDFRQYPYDPLDDFLDDPLYEPLDPFEEPFETMLNAAFGPGSIGDFGPLDPLAAMNLPGPRIGEGEDRDSLGSLLGDAEAEIESTPPIRLGPDGICRTLGRLEKGIENSPPIRPGPDDVGKRLDQLEENIETSPPIRSEADDLSKTLYQLEDNIEKSPPIRPGPDDIGKMLGRLEKDIEDSPPIPPVPETEIKLFNDPGWGYPTPSIGTPSPLLGIYDNPSTQGGRSLPYTPNRRVGRNRGMSKHNDSGDEEIWCPLENDSISPQACKDCEYYESDAEVCMFDSEEETDSDNQDSETNE